MTGRSSRARRSRPGVPSRQLRRGAAMRADNDAVARQSFIEALLETIDIGIVSCDANGVFVLSNRAERGMFGFEAEIGGLEMGDIDSRIDVYDAAGRRLSPEEYPLTRALRGDDVSAVSVLAGPAGGPYRDIAVSCRQIISPDGVLLGAVGALTDVTAERRARLALAEEHRRLTEAQRVGQIGSFEHDFASGRWTFSDNLCLIWGLAPDDFTAERLYRHILDEDRPIADASWRAARDEARASSCEYRIKRADGEIRLIRSNFEVDRGADGQAAFGRGTHLDITDLRSAENAAKRANSFFNAVLTATPDYIFVTDVTTGAVIYGSPGNDVLGRRDDELDALGEGGILGLAHHDDAHMTRTLRAAARELDDGAVLQVQYRALHVDGSWRWLSHRVTPFRRDADGRVVETLAVVRDVSDVVDAEQRLIYAAQHDYLTGLPNRGLLVRKLEAALERSRRQAWEIAVLFCDLDGFKQVNDSGGHAVGDVVLLETARRLSGVMREGDTVARVGGDEFVIIVEPWRREDADASEAGDRAASGAISRAPGERVARRVADALVTPIVVGGVEHVVTASVGITYATLAGVDVDGEPTVTADAVLRNADAAMYRAKGHGKNRFEVFAGTFGRTS